MMPEALRVELTAEFWFERRRVVFLERKLHSVLTQEEVTIADLHWYRDQILESKQMAHEIAEKLCMKDNDLRQA